MTDSDSGCPSCNRPIPGGALFCPVCGAATPTQVGMGTVTAPAPGSTAALDPEQQRRVQRALGEGFRLGPLLGRGGFAEVYRATDLSLKREVAVKVLRPDLVLSASLSERFRREAEAVAKIRHPHVIPIYQVGEAEALAYYIMPLIEGESLQRRLSRGPLPIPEVRRILLEAARALSVAHKAGIVHRDVKPDNIMLEGEEARVVVMDFGIAKALDVGESGMTGTGMLLGTPHYMSPEQASGSRDIDHRSDLYSLGVVAYQMLAGRLPFDGDTVHEVLTRHLCGEAQPVEQLRPDTPDDLLEVVHRCMAREPARRWASADAIAARLDESGAPGQAAGSQGVGAARMLWRRALRAIRRLGPGRRAALAVAASAVLVAAAGAALIRLRAARAPVVVRLAVLPFENVGPADNAYFVDGIADEVRGKLMALPRLQVIARASSMQYRRTDKAPADVGRELGVDYLLGGTVRWARAADSTPLVHVVPELVSTATGAAEWQQAFDGSVTDVFRVQTDIAGRVASALGVELGAVDSQRLAQPPTANLAAYDAFLRGEDAIQGGTSTDERSLARVLQFYRQAVALDSTFARAWARIASTQSTLYASWDPSPEVADQARRAAERALSLAAGEPTGHWAMAIVAMNVLGDRALALNEITTALALGPGNAAAHQLAAQIHYRLFGNWDSARVHYERSLELNPRSAATNVALGILYLYLRDYPRAREALDRAQQISPTFSTLAWRARVAVADGNLAEARATVAAPSAGYGASEKAVFLATHGLIWVLDDTAQALLLRLTPSDFGDDPGSRASMYAQIHYLRGDRALQRAYADTAERASAEALAASPQSALAHATRGLLLAYAGRGEEAVEEGLRATALAPLGGDHYQATLSLHTLALIYVVTGQAEKAIDALETLLSMPYELSPGWLRIDPNFAPLRGNPRFERLLGGSGSR